MVYRKQCPLWHRYGRPESYSSDWGVAAIDGAIDGKLQGKGEGWGLCFGCMNAGAIGGLTAVNVTRHKKKNWRDLSPPFCSASEVCC